MLVLNCPISEHTIPSVIYATLHSKALQNAWTLITGTCLCKLNAETRKAGRNKVIVFNYARM